MSNGSATIDPFNLEPPGAPDAWRLLAPAYRLIERLARMPSLRAAYARARHAGGATFEARALSALGIGVVAEGAAVPAAGPLIVAANHPSGISDGLAVVDALCAVRDDVRLVANHLLARFPELADRCFFVDPFGGPAAAARSRGGLRAAHLWLRRGGAVVIFPSGTVAPRLGTDGRPIEAPWAATLGRLALATGATVVPAFVSGRNSALFYRAGRIHPALRTFLLGRELLRRRGSIIRVHFGRAVPLADGAAPRELTETIRTAVAALGTREPQAPSSEKEVVTAIDPARLEEDLEALGDRRLLSSGDLEVYCAPAVALPHVLPEIGRLRELTFRAVGEGTGRSSDLDEFDRTYLHLFVWDRRQRAIAGAYRVGQTDTILGASGAGGLYTRTLFQYDERLLRRLSPGLELGRAFVRAEYQRRSSALLLLWKGIGRLVSDAPRYRVLFGPVSISSRYSDSSRRLLMAFLEQNHRDEAAAELVQAVNPPRQKALLLPRALPIGDVDALVSRAERDGKGMPVLLRQYLRLGARLLAFNVDPAFADALDALVMVDLAQVDGATLARYLGRTEAAQFLATHRPAAA